MPILDKFSSMQVPEVNFNCRQKADLMNTSSQNKGNADVDLLVACKVQLSSEVIRWKTESLRLQKECNVAQQKGKELDQTVSKLLDKTKELENQLSQAKEENKHLRLRNVLIDDTKSGSMQRLSQSLNKYNSFPTASSLLNPSLSRLSGNSVTDPKQEELAVRQVSQEMFQQMKREMKELQEMNLSISVQDTRNDEEGDQTDCKEELEETISTLVSEASSLKHHLLEQRKKLYSLIRDYNKDFGLKESISTKRRNQDTREANVCTQSKVINQPSIIKSQESPHKVSHNNVVEPFCSDLHIIREPTVAWNYEDDLTIHPTSNGRSGNFCVLGEETNTTQVVPERVCPICQKQFDSKVPQDVFEEHVFDHLEQESESFLDQFVML